MRLVLSAVLALAGCALSTSAGAPPAGAEPYNCPPACNSIPASAWIVPSAIPLDDHYGWPEPAGLSVRVPSPRFRFEELCATTPAAADPRGYAVTEQAVVVNPPGQWQLQVQVLHWRGETWRGGQLVADTFAAAALVEHVPIPSQPRPVRDWLSGSNFGEWCRRRELNPRPAHYECAALPLSYCGARWDWAGSTSSGRADQAVV